ncbi:MAG: hypothetical protein IPF58_14145 [Saprospirales bacterium]|nr:hypothetical protein [Saprospirales bacterium]
MPITINANAIAYRILLNTGNCSVEIYDEDNGLNQDDLMGSFNLNLTGGSHSFTSSGNTCTGSYSIKLQANPALDVYWGLQKSYDYFFNQFGYRNAHTTANINLPYSFYPNNAVTNPTFSTISFGLGDNIKKPYTSLDIVEH